MTFDEIVMEGFLEVAAFELCLRHAERGWWSGQMGHGEHGKDARVQQVRLLCREYWTGG